MELKRVVVTGLGALTPIGISIEEYWKNLRNGVSGAGMITRFDASNFKSRIAGEVKAFDVTAYLPPKEARRMDVFIHYGMAAGIQAIRDSGLAVTPENAVRIGVNIGSGIGGLPMIEETHNDFLGGGPRKISPFFIPGTIINMISGNLSIMFGLKGPNLAVVTACTTGLHAIGTGFRMIQYGDADVMVCGGAESTVTPLAIGGFASAQALSTRNEDPATASRPWDKGRDGFVLGEGAGVLVLEEYEHAKNRDARIYAEVVGFGMSGDAFHMTAPDTDGPRRSMENALTRVPLLKLLYTSIRDLINAFVGDKKRFDRPVAVAFTESARALGFVTRETLHGLHLPGHVAVYFPQSYNFAGNLLIVPKELVEPLDVHPTDMMAFIVSGGVSGLGIGSHGESMPPSMPPDRPTDQKTLIGHQGPGER